MFSDIKNCIYSKQVLDTVINPGITNTAINVISLAEAIKNNRCSPTELSELEDILSSPESSEQFFNDPAVQLPVLEGLIAGTYMDERVVAAMETCPPCLSSTDQEHIFNNQFSWLATNQLTPHATIALRFFTDIPAAEEIRINPKLIPYQSKKHVDQNLNGQARFEGTQNPIFCRHLAIAVLDEIDTVGNKISYENFSSTRKIAKHIKAHIEAKYKHIKSSATEAHVIKNANWGEFIAKQFEAMDTEGLTIKKMLVESNNHTMNAWLRIKVKDGKKCYVVHFYDPNSTTTHTRAKAYDLASMQHWTLGAFINIDGKQREQLYYPETQAISIIYVVPESDRFNSQNEQDKQPNQAVSHRNRELSSHDFDWDATSICHLMAQGFAGTLKKIPIKTLAQSGTDLLTLLNAKDGNGTPGLFMALQNGHDDAISAYGELLEAAGISGADLLTLLSTEDTNGTPGLYMALQEGRANAIRAYGELLKAMRIPDTELLTLLNAKDTNGRTGLFMALQEGHADAIKAYGELLKAMRIPDTELLTLLNAKDTNGRTGLFMALQEGHADAIKAYGELLEATRIPDTELLALLSTTPGLYIALQEGYLDAVLAYCQIVITIAPQLNKNQKTLLLTTIKESHSTTFFGIHFNDDFYDKLKRENPKFYRQFKAMKHVLKQ